jgi:predicted MFS family arabinose efflux permease
MAVWAVLVMLVLWFNRDAIDDKAGSWAHETAAAKPGAAPSAVEHPMAFLKLPSVWLCFSFFFWSTCALSAIQSFASPALQAMYGLPLSITAFVVTGYMLCGAAGMVVGGFLTSKTDRLEKIIGICLLGAAVMLALVGTGVLPGLMAAAVAALAGFGAGLAGPSRDMLIKQAAPPGATGRVYGTVYSGLDLGFALAAPVFGAMLDRGSPNAVFYGAAVALAVGVISASLVGVRIAVARAARQAVA